jgi:cellulase
VHSLLTTCSPGDCTTLTPSALRWSKISQSAIVSPGTWVTDTLIKNKFKVSTVLPAKLAPGNYVIRHEIIALHGGQNVNGAQLYPQCKPYLLSTYSTFMTSNVEY